MSFTDAVETVLGTRDAVASYGSVSPSAPSAGCTSADGSSALPVEGAEQMPLKAEFKLPPTLMPKKTTLIKIEELMARCGTSNNPDDQDTIMECVIDSLASFFKVSKQAAKIRMIDLGYSAAKRVYNYENGGARYSLTINAEAAVQEYISNFDFQILIDSGLFLYVDRHFVINNERYIIKHSNGHRALTEYAKANISECALHFTYRHDYPREHDMAAFERGIYRSTNVKERPQLQHYEKGEHNISVVIQADELYKKQADFTVLLNTREAISKPFWSMAYEIIQSRHWNSSIFTKKTLLAESVYSRIKNGHLEKPDVRTVVVICAGLDLDIFLSLELLASAGHVLTASREDQAYFFIIYSCRGESIQKRNEFLKALDITPLGVKSKNS